MPTLSTSAGLAVQLDAAPPLRGGESAVYLAGNAVVKVALSPLPFGAWLLGERDRLAELGADPATAALVPKLLGHGAWDGRPFLVLERFETSLDRVIPTGDPARRLALARRVAEVVTRLHAARPGLVHRDLKPSNFLLDGDRLVVSDFGCARERPTRATTTRALYTPDYAPPEQCLPHRTPDPAWDVFGLAATLFHVLTGRAAEAPARNAWRLTPRGIAARDGRDDGRGEPWEYLDFASMTALTPADRARLRAAVTEPARGAIAAALAPDPRARRGTARGLAEAVRASSVPRPRWIAAAGALGVAGVAAAAVVAPRSPPPYPVVAVAGTAFGVHEVDQALWRSVAGDGLETRRRLDPQGLAGTCAVVEDIPLAADDLPMVCVSFLDAVRFANRLSERHGLAPAYRVDEDPLRGAWSVRWDETASGWRLPTVAEWMALAHGADLCSDNLADRSHQARFPARPAVPCDDGFVGPAPVGALPAGPHGLRGLRGNVEEWLWDGDAQRAVAIGKWESVLDVQPMTAPVDAWVRAYGLGFRLARRP